jgi:hypothetical protein
MTHTNTTLTGNYRPHPRTEWTNQTSIINKQKQRWEEFVATLDHRTDSVKLYRTIRSLTNSNSDLTPSHSAITTTDTIPSRKQQSKILINYYASISHLPKHRADRQIYRRKHKFPLENNYILATASDTSRVIKRLKNSSAMGPDNISNIHLKHLGPHGITTLTNIDNFSIANCIIPYHQSGKPAKS